MVSSYLLGLALIGLLLMAVGWGSEWINRLPLNYAILYLIIGVVLGPYGIDLIQMQLDTKIIERFSEFVLIVSLYSCGLKISRPLNIAFWNSTIRLAGLLMPLTIAAVMLAAHWLLQLPWGAALLLGAILAPTDPVLASEVQLNHAEDPNELRFGLTSESGLNESLAFPFVLLGLYWLEDTNPDHWFPQWAAIDLFWSVAIAVFLGILIAKVGIWLNHQIQKRQGLNDVMADLVALGLILLVYAVTQLANGYGFLAVFVTGVAIQKRGCHSDQRQSQREFVSQIEKLLEVGAILLLGSLLRVEQVAEFGPQALLIAGLLFFLIRPLGGWLSTVGGHFHPGTRLLFGWFGIRGIGSIHFISHAIADGIPGDFAAQLRWIVYFTVLLSIVIHGISATPLVAWHEHHIGESRR